MVDCVPAPTIVRRAVVLTALRCEYVAVRAHLDRLEEIEHAAGTIYERGTLVAGSVTWQVAIAEIGAGNVAAAAEAERALTHFDPSVILFVGVAGGVKDVAIGDVVVALHVYGYERGKDTAEGFRTRPHVHHCSHALVSRARAEARKDDWRRHLHLPGGDRPPNVHLGPIAAGEKVVASHQSAVGAFLREHYGDTLAIEMEGIGFLAAAHAGRTEALVVRGVSDMLDGKSDADASGGQARASAAAAAFAFTVLGRFRASTPSATDAPEEHEPPPPAAEPGELLRQVEELTRLRLEDRDRDRIERLFEPRWGDHFLRINRMVDGIPEIAPVAAVSVERCTSATLALFEQTLHARYAALDPSVRSTLVVDSREPIPEALVRTAARRRIRLVSYIEYRGLIDFRSYRAQVLDLLRVDHRGYRTEHYVTQRLRMHGAGERVVDDALAELERLATADDVQFILVLGDFGTGKSFLSRELTRVLAADPRSPVPVRIEMRDLEKTATLDELVTAHFKRMDWSRPPDSRAFNRMLHDGQIVLVFDGYDELAIRVSYRRAAAHLDTLLSAAQGSARVIVTSRTQHFLDHDQLVGFGRHVAERGVRFTMAELLPFERPQILAMLTRHVGNEQLAHQRLELLEAVRDLSSLAANPRMLSFMLAVPVEDLETARDRGGKINAAMLYRMLLERWLGAETDRMHGESLAAQERWSAVRVVARYVWNSPTRRVSADDLPQLASEAVPQLMSGRGLQIDEHEAAHSIGSGTLLVRDPAGTFSFIHQSVLEWLICDLAAGEPDSIAASKVFGARTMSSLMVDFFIALVGAERASAWARAWLGAGHGEVTAGNARSILASLGEVIRQFVDYSGQDHSGRRFADEDLRAARFDRTTLVAADFSHSRLAAVSFRDAMLDEARLPHADLEAAALVGASLRHADLRGANLAAADLTRADLRGAQLAGASLRDAVLTGARFDGANLLGAHLDDGVDGELFIGAAVFRPESPGDRVSIASIASPRALAFHPEGRLLAVANGDDTVRVWELNPLRELTCMANLRETPVSLAFSADGATLAIGFTSRVEIVRLADARVERRFHSRDTVQTVALTSDGRTVATAIGRLKRWIFSDLEAHDTSEFLERSGQFLAVSACFSPDNTLLAYGTRMGFVELWTIGGETRSIRLDPMTAVLAVQFTDDGRALLAATAEGELWQIDLFSGTATFGHKELDGHVNATSMALSTSGRSIAAAFATHVVLRPTRSPAEGVRLVGDDEWVHGLVFSPDGATLYTGATRGTEGGIRLWDVATGCERARLLGPAINVTSIACSRTGTHLATGCSDGSIGVWNLASGTKEWQVRDVRGSVSSVAFHHKDVSVVSTTDTRGFKVWSRGDNTPSLWGAPAAVYCAAVSPDGKFVACGGDHLVAYVELARSKWHQTADDSVGNVRCLAHHPRRALFAAGTRQGLVLIVDGLGTIVSQLSVEMARGVPPCDYLDSFLSRMPRVTGVAFSPDGTLLAACSTDSRLNVWNVADGSLVRSKATRGRPRALAFAPDGRHVAVATDGGMVDMIRVADGERIYLLAHLRSGWAVVTPDGRYKLGGDTRRLYASVNLCRFGTDDFAEVMGGPPLALDVPLLPAG
jgi:WD40 repeat protein/nucleoside phosphorylase